jgi:ABC-type phosphate/phosphonate transport system substrate-binding protein
MLRFATFLAPALYPVYEHIARHVGRRLGVATELIAAARYDQLADADVCFVCGLAYVELCGPGKLPFVPVAAPVLQGERYGGRPVYFSDVIVHRDSPFRDFADLRGATWCYNEPLSHSGHGVTLYHLATLGETGGYFGRVIEAGWHQTSIRLVASREVDASAVDSHVLALAVRERPRLADELRVVASLGPSTVQPVVAAEWLSEATRAALREALTGLAECPECRAWLARGLIDRFVPVDDGCYDDLREMRDACARAGLTALR